MRKRKRDRKTIRKPPEPDQTRSKLEIDSNNLAVRGQESDERGQAKGIGRAVVLLEERLRRTAAREPLREIDQLIRVRDKQRGTA